MIRGLHRLLDILINIIKEIPNILGPIRNITLLGEGESEATRRSHSVIKPMGESHPWEALSSQITRCL